MAKLYGVGVGPGDPELMTLKAVRILRECDVLAVPGLNPKESVALRIAERACPEIREKEIVYLTTPMTKDAKVLEQNYREAADRLETILSSGQNIALLTLGDPTIYSTYIYMHRLVVADGFEAEIVNGIPSFCAAAAALGDSLGDREQSIHIIPASYCVEEELELPGTKVLMKAGSRLSEVIRVVREKGYWARLVENLGMENERIFRDGEELPEDAGYYSIVIIKE